MLLFAYGTLQDPRRVVALVGGSLRCRVVAAATVAGVLYDVRGEYPALRPAERADDIVPGVVLEIDDSALPRLDEYEGVSEGLYVRERCEPRLQDGRSVEAWVYVYNQPTAALRRIPTWPPGAG